jgi:polyketide biosynthesis acyl carrier protein
VPGPRAHHTAVFAPLRRANRQIMQGNRKMTREQILQIIIDHAREVIYPLRKDELHPDDSLEQLGANSVERMEILLMTLESLSLDIPRTETFGPKNIGELAQLLCEKKQANA